MKKQFTHLITFSVLLTVALGKRFKKADTQEALDAALGALRLGTTTPILVPDSASEHPLILNNLEDQPLCTPNAFIEPSRELKVMAGYEYSVLANDIESPRKLLMDRSSHLLVSASKGIYSIRTDKCGNTDIQLILNSELFSEPLGSGLESYGQHLFVATTKSIYRFPYSDGQHSALKDGVQVMRNLNPAGSLEAPDVVIDVFGQAYVSSTVDRLSDPVSHAVIKKFDFKHIPEDGYDYLMHGQVFSFGVNTQGLMGLDAQSNLWGINGLLRDDENAGDLSDFAEELNKYHTPSMNYGFPYCLTKHSQPVSKNEQLGRPELSNQSLSLDAYCQDQTKNVRPTVPLSHEHASNVHFYTGVFCSVGDMTTDGTSVGLPCNWTNTPILANHGHHSAGHSVVHLPFLDLGHQPQLDKKPEILLQDVECDQEKCFSPIGLAHDNYGRLYISSDQTNEILMFRRTFNEKAAQRMTDIVENGKVIEEDED
ncbi:unnamed protein product [Rhizopus stolonifer]